MAGPAISVHNLRKSYGDHEALRGISFQIAEGEVFGLLGPNGAGKTILLTTHYLDEAEQLADRVAVLREGRIVREGAPAELTGGSDETEIRFRRDGHVVVLRTTEPTRLLNELTTEALAEGRELEGLSVRRPTLEDVYLELTAEEES